MAISVKDTLGGFLIETSAAFFYDKIKNKVKQKELKHRISDYIESQKKYNYNNSLKEEFDFGGLNEYINEKFYDNVHSYLLEIEPNKRKVLKKSIISNAYFYSGTHSELSKEKVRKIITTIIDIIEGFCKTEFCKGEYLFLLGQISDILHSSNALINEKLDELKNILTTYQNADFNFLTIIDKQKTNIKNQAIFPWFKDSPKYIEVFPKLFVDPLLDNHTDDVSYKILFNDVFNNIVILGDAGAGKSTLMRYLFAFSKIQDNQCIYLTAREALSTNQNGVSLLSQIINYSNMHKFSCLVLIDGIDEAFHNDYNGFKKFISDIKFASHCTFWLGCRTDFYNKSFSDDIAFVENSYTLCPWNDEQIDNFVAIYSEITKKAELSKKIDSILGTDETIITFKHNPFQLAILCFLAEDSKEGEKIKSIYDLYERFIQKWLDKEHKRGTSKSDNVTIIRKLQTAAWQIYNNEKYVIDEISANNTAIKDLLIVDDVDIYNRSIATAFYHRSLAAFFLAQSAIEAMLSNDINLLEKIFPYKLKDDVTNFIGAKFSTLTVKEKFIIKQNLENLYYSLFSDDTKLSEKEQIIYYITRLGIDVSEFLKKCISPHPQNPIMRLTIAYGAVLSEDQDIRTFALEYAKSIANESEDAITNRAWTVIYFGDVDNDPYTYRDNEKSSWKKARNARIKRFTKTNPRLKDYRFRLFDIPLFHSFLKDRNWDNISMEEFEILSKIDIPEHIFNTDECAFLKNEKEQLLSEYKKHLLLAQEK